MNIAEADLEHLRKIPGIGEKKGKAIMALRADGGITMEKLVLATNVPQSEWAALSESGKVTIPGVQAEELRLVSPDKSPVSIDSREQVEIMQREIVERDRLARENEEKFSQHMVEFEERRRRESREREDKWRGDFAAFQDGMERCSRENEERWARERGELQECQERMAYDFERARRERDELKEQLDLERKGFQNRPGGGYLSSSMGGKSASFCHSPPNPRRLQESNDFEGFQNGPGGGYSSSSMGGKSASFGHSPPNPRRLQESNDFEMARRLQESNDFEMAWRERDELKEQLDLERKGFQNRPGGGYFSSSMRDKSASLGHSSPNPRRLQESKQTVQFQLKTEAPEEKSVLEGRKRDPTSEFIAKVEKKIPQDGIYSRKGFHSLSKGSSVTKTAGGKMCKTGDKAEGIEPVRWEVAAEQSQIKEYLKLHAGDLEPEVDIDEGLNQRIHLFQGDITSVKSEVLVTAANSQLRGGSGVDGAIHRAAGPGLAAECRRVGHCPVGTAVITGAHWLEAQAVIHTVGPKGESKQDLANCYWSVLDLAVDNGYSKIVIPVISGGAYGYAVHKSVRVALKSIRAWMLREDNYLKMEQIVLCVFSSRDCEEYVKNLARIFPTSGTVALYRRNKIAPGPAFREVQTRSVAILSDDEEQAMPVIKSKSRSESHGGVGRKSEARGVGGSSLRFHDISGRRNRSPSQLSVGSECDDLLDEMLGSEIESSDPHSDCGELTDSTEWDHSEERGKERGRSRGRSRRREVRSKSVPPQKVGYRKRSPPPPKMQTFHGERAKWRTFLFSFRQTAGSQVWDSSTKLERLISCMREKAIDYIRKRHSRIRNSYRALLIDLHKRYGRKDPPSASRRQLSYVKQDEEEDIEDFAERVHELVIDGYPRVDEANIQLLAVDAFLRGCRDKLAALLAAGKKSQTLQRAVRHVKSSIHDQKALGRPLNIRQVAFAPVSPSRSPSTESTHRGSGGSQSTEVSDRIAQLVNEAVRKAVSHLSPSRFRSSSPQSPSRGRGECFTCGKGGHFARNCPNSPQTRNGTCFSCGKVGHFAKDCPDKSPKASSN